MSALSSFSTPTFSFFFSCSDAHRDLHSFPTRRSSDLDGRQLADGALVAIILCEHLRPLDHGPADLGPDGRVQDPQARDPRSEEHTSELQSHSDLVCRLLLEKKKQTDNDIQVEIPEQRR